MTCGTLLIEKGIQTESYDKNEGKGELMFELDLKSRKSIYEQVIDNLKEQIMTGKIPHEFKLPSVRELSKIISVNPNTVQKAYRELERQGYIYTLQGVGTFVADKGEIIVDQNILRKAKEKLKDAIKQILYLGIGINEVRDITSEMIDSIEREGTCDD